VSYVRDLSRHINLAAVVVHAVSVLVVVVVSALVVNFERIV